jgi:hypothetical protein
MKKTRILLVTVLFVAGIGSGYRTKFAPINGYSRKVDIPSQTGDCVYRDICDPDGPRICTYSNKRLYALSTSFNCLVPLNKY